MLSLGDVPLVIEARRCIDASLILNLSVEGVGGTYIIKDEDERPIAVFKPIDEEPGGINNPKRRVVDPLLPPGGGYKREIAAWLLDHGNEAKVPETHFLDNVSHHSFCSSDGLQLKCGSVQKYIPNIGNAESMSSSRFITSDVHNIGILDIRMFNMDRNLENILVTRSEDGTYGLVPIDHSYTLPDKLKEAYFDWLHWSQAKKPFSVESKEFIMRLDSEKDAEILRRLDIGEDEIRIMKISTMFLKEGASAGLTLFDIGSMMCRNVNQKESFLEQLVESVEEKLRYSLKAIETDFFQLFQRTIRKELFKMKTRTNFMVSGNNLSCSPIDFTRSG